MPFCQLHYAIKKQKPRLLLFCLFICQHIINLDVKLFVGDKLAVYRNVLFGNRNIIGKSVVFSQFIKSKNAKPKFRISVIAGQSREGGSIAHKNNVKVSSAVVAIAAV